MRPYYDYDEPSHRRIQLGFGVTRTVKILILANVLVLVVFFIVARGSGRLHWKLVHILGMYPPYFVKGCAWQLVTYMFVHGGIGHLFWNMLLLFFFAGEVERVMGRKRFLCFYFASGAAGGLCALFTWELPTIGASGACLAVLIAFAFYFPDALVFLFLLIPIKVKYVAMLMGGLTVLFLLAGGRKEVSDWGHLGGMLYALFYIKAWPYLRAGLPRPRLGRFKFHSGQGKLPSDLEVRAKLDEILEKVHDQGMQSLTRKERKFLQDISKRYQR